MLSVTTSFLTWLNQIVSSLSPLIQSAYIQVPLVAFYLFRILHIFHRIIPDK